MLGRTLHSIWRAGVPARRNQGAAKGGGHEGPPVGFSHATAISELVKAGGGTVIATHMKHANREEALEHYLNLVIAGHISPDSIGMNLFFGRLAAKGIKIIPIAGLIRLKRK